MNSTENQNVSEVENIEALPTITSSFTSCRAPGGNPVPALSNVTGTGNQSTTTVQVTVAVDSNFTPTNNKFVSIVMPDPTQGGVFQLLLATPTITSSFSYYNLTVGIDQAFNSGDFFDISYSVKQPNPGPRTIRGTISCVGDPE